MKIRLLTFGGCPNETPTLELLEDVLAEKGVDASIERVEIDETNAQAERFFGSPTVQIDGQDIEPGMHGRSGFSLSCRTYPAPTGRRGVPPREMIREALAKANSPNGND